MAPQDGETGASRTEVFLGTMRFCRDYSLFHQGYLLGKYAVSIARPLQGLFVEDWI